MQMKLFSIQVHYIGNILLMLGFRLILLISDILLFRISGLFTILMGTICGGTRVITTEEFSPEMQFRIIEEYKATIVENQSFYLLDMLKSGLLPEANLSSVRCLFVGGFKVPDSIMKEFNRYLPNGSVCNAYGLTEIGYNIAIDYPYFTGKGGRIMNGFSVKVVDEQNKRCVDGVAGEICIKGRSKFLGYCKNQQLTDDAFDNEGYFMTGDIGRVDSQGGYLHISDRKKNVILYHNDWVFPADIEEVLLRSDGIKCACVVGVPYNEILELPAAVVIRANGSKITEQDICKMVEGNFGIQNLSRKHKENILISLSYLFIEFNCVFIHSFFSSTKTIYWMIVNYVVVCTLLIRFQ